MTGKAGATHLSKEGGRWPSLWFGSILVWSVLTHECGQILFFPCSIMVMKQPYLMLAFCEIVYAPA